jgi:CheY-like chemotaxis protein
MSKRRVAPRASRPVRIAIHGVQARIDSIECSLENVSETGAMLVSRFDLPIGHEATLVIRTEPTIVTARVRVARCDSIDVAMPGAVWRRQNYSIGVAFLERTGGLRRAVRALMKEASGVEQTSPRVLVIGERDPVTSLIDTTLTEADYVPTLLEDPRYAVRTAKRIGAKAIFVNLRIDPAFSARSVLDLLRADPATADLPVFVCARLAWLQSTHRTYLEAQRLRPLLVPFTPEELVMTLDRALSEERS